MSGKSKDDRFTRIGSIVGNSIIGLVLATIVGGIIYFMFIYGEADAEATTDTVVSLEADTSPLNPKVAIDVFMCEAFQLGVTHAVGFGTLNGVELVDVDLPCPDLEAYGPLQGTDGHLFCLAHIAGFISVTLQVVGDLPPEGWVERQVPLCVENVWSRHLLRGGFRLDPQLPPGGSGTPKSR